MASTLDATSSSLLPKALLVLNEAFRQWDGRLFCSFGWWRFAKKLADHFRQLDLYVPLAHEPPSSHEKPADITPMKVHGRFFFLRTEEYYARICRRRREMLRGARDLFARYDLILFRVPSPEMLALAKAAWSLRRPTVLLVGGDLLTGTAYAAGRNPKAMLARLAARYLRRKELRLARGSAFVGVWGEALLAAFSKVNPCTAMAASPVISRDDIYRRPEGRLGPVVRLLRVARLLPNKGLEYLLAALAIIRASGQEATLDIVGRGDDPAYEQKLSDSAARLGLGDHVRFLGHKEFGPQLFELYRRADIHVVSSVSEGMPRCIAEARAFGLPTVATRVGGIPNLVRHELDGLLVEPKNPQQIAQAVQRLVTDDALRQKIVQEGYRLVELETVEFQAGRLAALIAKALSNQPLGAAARDIHLA